ncbi:DUF3459 domain-containing protein [Kineococcus glutinatus]
MLLNLGVSAVPLPAGEVLLASGPDAVRGGRLVPDGAVWLLEPHDG